MLSSMLSMSDSRIQELQTGMDLLTEIFDTEDITVFALEFARSWSMQQIKDSWKEGSCLH